MSQAVLPLFPEDATAITPTLSFCRRDGMVYYFHGCEPVFSHPAEDQASFRMYVSQLYVSGLAKQAEINRAFGLPPISLKRWSKQYREAGVASFFVRGADKQRGRSKPRVLTPETVSAAAELLAVGESPGEVAKILDLKLDTLQKAIRTGKVHGPAEKKGGGDVSGGQPP